MFYFCYKKSPNINEFAVSFKYSYEFITVILLVKSGLLLMNLVAFIIPAGKMDLPQGFYQEESGEKS